MTNKFESSIDGLQNEQPVWNAKSIFSKLIQKDQLVGDLYSINYEEGKVLVHDFHRQKVGGIPSLCFLIATRVNPDNDIDYKDEDSSIILLRVMDATQIPQDKEAEKVRIETAQRISGEADKHWDGEETMDLKTRHVFSYAGIACRIIGTFYLEEDESKPHLGLKLKFGSDISNYYSNKGFKIFKPNGKALEEIVNYIDPKNINDYRDIYQNSSRVKLGNVRYASTNRKYQGVDEVPVFIYPADLLAQKSALFGMTRTGKSNTTKIIAKSIYELRHPKDVFSDENPDGDKPLRIGQIIFDPNGEYANENTQDASTGQDNPIALKNIWELFSNVSSGEERNKIKNAEVITYGVRKHNNDPDRILMKLNFYASNMLQNGKDIINFTLEGQESQYFKNFKQVRFDKPIKEEYEKETEFYEELKRYYRRELAYRALLKKAGFEPPLRLKPKMLFSAGRFLFSTELRKIMSETKLPKDVKKESIIKASAEILGKEDASWDSLASAFEGLFYFLDTNEYAKYNVDYIKKSQTGEGFADSDFERILEMFTFSKGTNLIGKATLQHDPNTVKDYAEEIYQHLLQGKLVIVDQSSGDYEVNKSAAERIMEYIFRGNQLIFRTGEQPKDIMIYIEEAHNLLPSSKESDMQDIWVRTAKEGSKYRLGLIYATQEVSSIQKNILKNTANWFISHLNNSDETKELCKYYDFADFEPSIRRAQDKGFLRVKTLSNMFVIPVQVDKFEIKTNK